MMSVTADVQSSTTTLVRFRISNGTTLFGQLDVELFDQDRPITVSNFLAQVRGGRYDNVILHDLVPGFILQGGAGTVANPFSSEPFELITRTSTNTIPNEFGVGSAHPNAFGTLAMAKNGSNTNSSATSWFFNMANNSDGTGITNLDASAAGYTVFGRVKTGTNLLTSFNALSFNQGIQNMTNQFHQDFCAPLTLSPDNITFGFDALPVGFLGTDCIFYSDLYRVEILILGSGDTRAPSLHVSFPPPNGDVQGDIIPVVGTASDAGAIDEVRVYLGTNPPVTASGTKIWTALIGNVPPGTNSIVAEASDAAGNRIQTVQRFFHQVRVPFLLSQVGNGKITGPTNGALLDLARGYTLVAKPDAGYLFAGWTGSISQSSTTLPFLMESNLALTAVFVPNPFPALKGTFNGLFYDTNAVEQISSGLLNLTLGTLGAYSGTVQMNGARYPFSGKLNVNGGETNLVLRARTNALLLRLQLDLTGGSERITGTVTNNQVTAIDANLAWSAVLAADRAQTYPAFSPSPFAGSYTLIVPTDTNNPAGPGGDGFGRAVVSAKGVVTLSGSLADGTPVTQGVPVSKAGAWPLYSSLYRGKGAVVSWLTFSNQATTDITGLLSWFKQAQPTEKFYKVGFSNQVFAAGSSYVPPTTGRVIQLTNGIVGFTNGNLTAGFANNITLGTDNKAVNDGPGVMTLTITKPTGLFSGTVTPPGGGPSRSYKGALLQKLNRGAGFLLGTNKSSQVRLDPGQLSF